MKRNQIYNRLLKWKTVHGETHLRVNTPFFLRRKYKEPFPHHFKEPTLGRRTGGVRRILFSSRVYFVGLLYYILLLFLKEKQGLPRKLKSNSLLLLLFSLSN